MASIYTRTGDTGSTQLFGGERVQKDDARVDAYGTIDELNAYVGLTRAATEQHVIDKQLKTIQDTLFSIGSLLATPAESPATTHLSPITEDAVTELEDWIDEYAALLPPLRAFIYPTGTELAARLHVCRTLCRRAERAAVHHETNTTLNAQGRAYLNRLSDYFFMLARYINWRADAQEVTWQQSDV